MPCSLGTVTPVVGSPGFIGEQSDLRGGDGPVPSPFLNSSWDSGEATRVGWPMALRTRQAGQGPPGALTGSRAPHTSHKSNLSLMEGSWGVGRDRYFLVRRLFSRHPRSAPRPRA